MLDIYRRTVSYFGATKQKLDIVRVVKKYVTKEMNENNDH